MQPDIQIARQSGIQTDKIQTDAQTDRVTDRHKQ